MDKNESYMYRTVLLTLTLWHCTLLLLLSLWNGLNVMLY